MKINQDLNSLLTNLDISPQMYNRAEKNYKEISAYLESNGFAAHFYPQGSFRLGTVVRPYSRGEEKIYDIDVMAQLFILKKDADPKSIKSQLGHLLRNHPRYSRYLQDENDRCWTLAYGENEFQLDLVPCVSQDDTYILNLQQIGVPIKYAEHAVAVTDKRPSRYQWCDSNPEGYAKWFTDVNQRFASITREEHRNKILFENAELFESIDEIPEMLDRSALQRVIQVLKRHRDIYFTKASISDDSIWDMRPSSVIITTLSTKIAAHLSPTGNVLELLDQVSNELLDHASLQDEPDSTLFEKSRNTSFVFKKNGVWRILNPVNPNDNYSDLWTAAHAEWFFKWLKAVTSDFATLGNNYYGSFKNAFGTELVESILPESANSKSVNIVSETKPYYNHE